MHLFLHGCPEILRLIPSNPNSTESTFVGFSSYLTWLSIGSFGLKTETTCLKTCSASSSAHCDMSTHLTKSSPPALKGCLFCTRFGSPISAEIYRKTSATPRQTTLGRTSELWNSTEYTGRQREFHVAICRQAINGDITTLALCQSSRHMSPPKSSSTHRPRRWITIVMHVQRHLKTRVGEGVKI